MSNYNLKAFLKVLQTSEQGDKLTSKSNSDFKYGVPNNDNLIKIQPDELKQTLQGIGTSFTESSAFVLAHLELEKRAEVMKNIFSEQGANFSLTRTHIASCDFCVEGHYSYANAAIDKNLQNFSIAVDQDGFKAESYPGIRDESFDLLPMIKQAQAIKAEQLNNNELNIIASAWTAPPEIIVVKPP